DEVGQPVQGPVVGEAVQQQPQGLPGLLVERLQQLAVGLRADDGALVGGDVGVDPLLGPVVARAGLVEGGQRVGRVEVVQDAQRLVLVAGGDVGDGGQR